MKIGIGKAGAKIILIGEHSVVYGKPAIAIPFNGIETMVEITKTNDDLSIDSMYYKGLLNESPLVIEGVSKLIYYVLDKLNIKKFGLHFKINSNILGQRGLGSSASVSIAIVRAIYNAFNLVITNQELINLAMYAEKINHSNPSGLDVYTIVYQKPILFVKDEGFRILNINLNAYLLIVDSNLPSKTKIAVDHVRELYNKDFDVVNQVFIELAMLTNNASNFLATNEIEKLGQTMNLAQVLLEKIEVSNETINNLIESVKKFQVLGSKLTGGGMGGSIILLVKTKEEALKIKDELSNNKVWLYNLGDLKNDKSIC